MKFNYEPAAIAEMVRAVIVAVVALGWVTIDETAVNAVVTVVALVGSGILSLVVRNKVTPTAKLEGCDVNVREQSSGSVS